MKIVVFCNDFLAFPSIEFLGEKKLLAGLVVPTITTEILPGIRSISERFQIPFFPLSGGIPSSSLGDWLRSQSFDVAFVMTFPHRIPENILNLIPGSFFNWHPGLLPGYRGPDPIFWQILNQEPFGGMTVHKMTVNLDSGPVAFVEQIRILSEDTYGKHLQKLGSSAKNLTEKMVLTLSENPNGPTLFPQDESKSGYQKMPGPQDLIIKWSFLDASRARALIHACNPVYGGAVGIFRGLPVRMFRAASSSRKWPLHLQPGTVVTTNDGLEVICADHHSVRLEIVDWCGTLFGGMELAQMLRVQPGETFQTFV
jgi:methionyl-tRNA formyltransferase